MYLFFFAGFVIRYLSILRLLLLLEKHLCYLILVMLFCTGFHIVVNWVKITHEHFFSLIPVIKILTILLYLGIYIIERKFNFSAVKSHFCCLHFDLSKGLFPFLDISHSLPQPK